MLNSDHLNKINKINDTINSIVNMMFIRNKNYTLASGTLEYILQRALPLVKEGNLDYLDEVVTKIYDNLQEQ